MLKEAVQAALRPFNVKLARIQATPPERPFNVFEFVLAKAVADAGKDFRFIQVGANDGVLNDGLAPLIRRYGIAGCLVEPMPDVFERLKANYADQPQLTFANCMIGPNSGTGTIHRFKPNAPVPAAFFHGLAREDAGYIQGRAKAAGLPEFVEEVRCPMRTFADLLRETGYDRLDLLYVDTEGNDDRIVYQALDAGVLPAIINFEWTEMGLQRHCALKERLAAQGYRFVDVAGDTVCVKG